MGDAWEKLKPTNLDNFGPGTYRPPEPPQPDQQIWSRLAPTDLRTMTSAPPDPFWSQYRSSRYASAYANLKDLAEIQYKDRPEKKEDELQKIQLSFYLGDRLDMEPEDVYAGWDSQGRNPYAETYFKATAPVVTYAGYMKNETERAFRLYAATNQASEMMLGPFNREKLDALQASLEKIPPELPTRDQGALWNFLKRVPARALAQAPYLLDMGLAELVVGTVGAGIGGLAAGPAGAAKGFLWGRRLGGLAEGTRLDAAQIFMDAMTYPDPNTGKPLYQVVRDPEELWALAQKTGLAGGVLTGVASGIAFESMIGRLPQLMQDMGLSAIRRAGEQGVFRGFIGQMLQKYGKNLGTQMTMMDLEILVQQVAANAIAAEGEILAPSPAVAEMRGAPKQVKAFTPKDYMRLALQGLPGAFETSLLIALPGSIGEARRGVRGLFAQEQTAAVKARLGKLEELSDTTRPLQQRAVEIDSRLEELRQQQEKLAPELEAITEAADIGRDLQKKIETHRNNQIEIQYLESLKQDAEARAPDQPWQRTRGEQETIETARQRAQEAETGRIPGQLQIVAARGLRSTAEGTLEAGLREQDIVNPIPRDVSTAEKVRALKVLSDENKPILDAGLAAIRTQLRLEGKSSYKLPERIIEKATRPIILAERPWHDVEHIRDALRFKVISNTLEDFGNSLRLMLEKTGAQVVELDTGKLFEPRGWGWRFAGADLRMPNGQLVEFYTPLKELEAAKKAGNHALFEKWRNKDINEVIRDPAQAQKYYADLDTSRNSYEEAFSNAMRRLGTDRNAALASWKNLTASLEGLVLEPTGDQLSLRSSGVGAPTSQPASSLIREKAGQPAEIRPSSLLEITQGIKAAIPSSTSMLTHLEQLIQSENDLSPSSPVVATLRRGLPNLTIQQAQGAALYGKLLASHVGEGLGLYISKRFVEGVFSPEKAGELEAAGHRGAIAWTNAGKRIFYTTTKSDFVTWVHEMTHQFETDLTPFERGTVERWLGITGAWSEQNKETFAQSAVAYMAKGLAPNQELAPVFARFTRWVNQVYEGASVEWQISPDIIELYNKALSGQVHAPTESIPGDVNVLFETRPREGPELGAIEDPADLTTDRVLRSSDFQAAWKRFYYDDAGNVIISSRLQPAELSALHLQEGMWMVDDGFKGIHGHEIAQLRWLDPYKLELQEPDYTKEPNYEGRGDDARRYAAWMKEGKTPPPVTVVETGAGTLRVIDGHRRTAAAKWAEQMVLAWVYPIAEHPQGLTDSGTGRIVGVGLTYEMATGRDWQTDQPTGAPGTLYETRPGDQDPWIVKSRQLILEKMKGPMPAQDLRNMLEKGGVKPEEMEWLGLDEFLKGNKKIRPEEILQHIKDNDLQLKELIAEEIPEEMLDVQIEKQRELWITERAEELQEQADQPLPSYEVVPFEDPEEGTRYFLEVEGERVDWYERQEDAEAAGEKIVDNAADEAYSGYLDRARDESDKPGIARGFRGEAEQEIRKSGDYSELEYAKWQLPGEKTGEREMLIQLPWPQEITAEQRVALAEGKLFRSGHWPEVRNVLVHIRFNERTDVDGKRILLIEEIQSDWHQRARSLRKKEIRRLMKEKGISKEEATQQVPFDWAYKAGAILGKMPPGFTIRRITAQDLRDYGEIEMQQRDWGLFDNTGEYISSITQEIAETAEQAEQLFIQDAEAIGIDLQDIGGTASLLPDAPFKKTWHELAFKRMVRWAAENGFDAVAWTTGEQQANRYSLEKHIDQLEIRRQDIEAARGTGKPDVWAVEGKKNNRSIISRAVNDIELEEMLGEEIAEKGLELKPGESIKLKGEDLRVGGQGMRGFYDKMLVDYAAKFGKKFEAKIGDINIGPGAMTPEGFRESMRAVLENIINEEADRTEAQLPSELGAAAARMAGALDEGKSWQEVLNQETRYGAGLEMVAKIVSTPEVNRLLEIRNKKALIVHALPITDAMRDSVLSGQLLFAPGPHEENVHQAVEKQMPVPYKVLREYQDREWVRAELDIRDYLTSAARQVETFEEFFDWQAKSHQGTIPNESYYRLIWDRSRETAAPSELADQHFKDAMDADAIHHALGSIFLSKGDVDQAAIEALSPEMFSYGMKILDEVRDPELEAQVKAQIDAEPARWRRILGDAMPDDLKQELKLSLDAADLPDFVPVIPKVANERFTDWLQDPKQMIHFLLTVGSDELEGKNKTLARLAGRVETELDYDIAGSRHWQAMKEVRKNITLYRELYAVATGDEVMMRQLQAEIERAPETEETRLLTENTRLRREVASYLEQMKLAARESQVTIADLNRHVRTLSEKQAGYEAEIVDGRQRLKERMREAKEEQKKKIIITDVIRRQLDKKRIEELQERANEERAALKAKIRQVRDVGKQKLIAERQMRQVEKWAEYINRPVNAGIADLEARQIEDIQSRIEYDPADVNESLKNRLREWRRQHPTAPLPPALVQMIEARSPKLITAAEMRQLYDQVKILRTKGRKNRMAALLTERQYMDSQIKEVTTSIMGGQKPKDLAGLGTRGARRQVRTPGIKKMMWATWRMNRIAEIMDHRAGGPATRWLWDKINDNTDETIRELDAYSKINEEKVRELMLAARQFGKQEKIDGLTLTHGEMIGVYIYSQFEDSLFALQEDNKIAQSTIANIVKALSPEEKKYGDWMIETLSTDADFDRLQAVQLSVSNQRMDRLPRYFPIQRQGMSGNPLLSELARELLEMAGKTSKPRPRAGFLRSRMERTPGVSFPPMRLDAPAVFMDHIAKREFYIANALDIKRMIRIFDSREVKAAMLDRFGDGMQPLVQGYLAQYTNPNIYRAFEDYGEFARILRSNVGLSLLGSNVLTMLRQIPDIPQIMMMAGPVDGIRAAAEFLTNPRKMIQEVWEKAPQLKRRSYDRFIEEMKMLDRNAYERVIRGAGEAGFAVLKAMDTVTNVIGWKAIYNKTLRRTGNETVARNKARDFILRKRPAARAKDLAAIYRSPGLSWFLMFSNQVNQQWNILTFDIPQKIAAGFRGEQGAFIDASLNVTALLIGAVGMGLIARKGVMTKEGLIQDFFNMLLGYTPFIGNAFESAIRGQPSMNPLNPFGGAYQVGKLMYDIASQAETDKVMRDLQNALFTLGGTAGLPVVQARRIYKTIDTGDPWELVGGPPKEKK